MTQIFEMVTQPIKLERTTEAEPAALARKPGAYVRAQCCYLILALAALMIAVHILREGTLVAASRHVVCGFTVYAPSIQ